MNADWIMLITVVAVMMNIRRPERWPAIMALVGAQTVHRLFFADDPGATYYYMAALCDAVAALAIFCMPPSPFHSRLIALLSASVFSTALGWALFMLYEPPTLYNSAIMYLALIQAAIIGMDDGMGRHLRGAFMAAWLAVVRPAAAHREQLPAEGKNP